MNDEISNKIKDLAHLTCEDIGIAEEGVKINFIVRLLEYLGHRRIDFEYKNKDILIKKGLLQSASVIVETKSYEKNLVNELNQLERYCHEERPLVGIIANGKELMVFSYSWRFRPSFQNQMIYHISRNQLSDDNIIIALEKILSRSNLKDGSAIKNVMERERDIENAENKIKEIKINGNEEEKIIEAKLQELTTDLQRIEKEIEDLKEEKNKIDINKKIKTSNIWKGIGICPLESDRRIQRRSGLNSDKHKKLGRKGYENLKDYLLPVIRLIKDGCEYKEAFHRIAEKLDVGYSTVSAQCTRQLKISLDEFIEYVQSGRIVHLLKDKFPERSEAIEQELRN